MVVLRAIGRFFAKIGRWIRDTAWIQPLLIVGGIFAIIFSIPYITKWVQSWFSSGNASESYYEKRELSWKNIDKGTSEVDEFFSYISDYDKEKANNSDLYKEYGSKFFMVFVQEGCEGCENDYYGFKTLQSNWDTYVKNDPELDEASKDFKLFTIYIDEEDEDEEVEKNYFKKYITGDASTCRYTQIFEDFSTFESNYTNRKDLDIEPKFVELVTSPTVLLFDFDFEPKSGDLYTQSSYGLSEVFFEIGSDDASTNNEKARFVWECWTHSGVFSKEGK